MSATIKPKSISQHKLNRLLELERAVEEYKLLKDELIAMAVEGLPCQPGPLSCKVSIRAGHRRPQWREEAMVLATKLNLDPEAWCKTVVERTKVGASSYSIEVVNRDAPLG